MTPEFQTALTVSVPTLTVLIGILVNISRLNDLNARFSDLGVQLNQRIDDLRRLGARNCAVSKKFWMRALPTSKNA